MQTVAIEGTLRKELGKKATKAVRSEGLVPCVIYGGEENVHFTAPTLAFRDVVYTADFKIAEISVEGNAYRTILKDIQFHPVTEEIQHIDFIQLIPEKTVIIEVPVRLEGVSPGVKKGGKLMQMTRRLKVKLTPENLVSELTVDISGLELGRSIRVRDIKEQENVQILNSPGIPLATVEIPRALRSQKDAEAKEAKKG